MNKRKTLRASFVFSLAGTASLAMAAPGCFDGATTNPPPAPSCPDDTPAPGTECEAEWVPSECIYPSKNECDGYLSATCVDAVWQIEYKGDCAPEPVVCPEAAPITGAVCEGVGTCEYSDDCGQAITATCQSVEWDTQYPPFSCNPPPPCQTYDTAAGCVTDPTCRWLIPGCAEGTDTALPQEGCYPATPCIDDMGCNPGSTCQQVVVLPPCEADGCACAAPAKVCL